jgi:hypothetical protein
MEEFKFVLRCLIFTSLLLVVSQYKWNDETLESRAHYFLVESDVAGRLRESAAGGVLFIKKSGENSYNFIKNKFFRDKPVTAQRENSKPIILE